MEAKVSQYGGYLLPPSKEICFKKQKGHLPEWINVKATEQIMCEKGKLTHNITQNVTTFFIA